MPMSAIVPIGTVTVGMPRWRMTRAAAESRPALAMIEAYLATGEPLSVAGAFTLDGLGGWFVDGIDGDPSSVVGLGLPLVRRLLAEVNVGISALWAGRGGDT